MRADQANEKSGDENSSPSLDVIVKNEARVSCNGGGGPLGHPQVWLNISNDGSVICPYCSQKFIKLTG